MKLSEGVEWGVHCAVLLAVLPPGATLSAARLAEYHGVPEPYLAKHLQAMSRTGIVESAPGARGGYRLARPAADVTMLDVVEAIDGPEPAFRCMEIRQRGPASLPASRYRVPCSIHAAMTRADRAWRAELRATTVAQLVETVARASAPDAVARAAEWLQTAMR